MVTNTQHMTHDYFSAFSPPKFKYLMHTFYFIWQKCNYNLILTLTAAEQTEDRIMIVISILFRIFWFNM